MLLIDGVKYELWTPSTEDEFEGVVKEHTQEIFGEQSIYLDRKQKLRSLSGIGSIPDGYVILFGDSPHWHIVEVELSSHPLHDHIVAQVGRFISGINNQNIQRGIVNAMDEEIARDDFIKLRLRKAIEPAEIYRFLTDLISKPPILTIIIEKDTEELREALSTLAHPQIRVVEFQTFRRVGAEAVHAYLFEPLYQASPEKTTITEPIEDSVTTIRKVEKRVTIKDLIDANIMKASQVVYSHFKGQRYEGKVLSDGGIELTHTGKKFPSINAAMNAITGTSYDIWYWWYTTRESGAECLLNDLREEYRETHPAIP